MCGVANGGLATRPSSTRAHRCDAGPEHRLPRVLAERGAVLGQPQPQRLQPGLALHEQQPPFIRVQRVQAALPGPPAPVTPVQLPPGPASHLRDQPDLAQLVVAAGGLRPADHRPPGRGAVRLDVAQRGRRDIESAGPLALGHRRGELRAEVPLGAGQRRQLDGQQRSGLGAPQPAGEQQIRERGVAVVVPAPPRGVPPALGGVPAQPDIPPQTERPRRQPLHVGRADIRRPRLRDLHQVTMPVAHRPDRHRAGGHVTLAGRPLVQPAQRGQLPVPLRPADPGHVARRAPAPVLEVQQVVSGRRVPVFPALPQEIEEHTVVGGIGLLRCLRQMRER